MINAHMTGHTHTHTHNVLAKVVNSIENHSGNSSDHNI